MSITWNDNTPIYRQLRDRVVALILDGLLINKGLLLSGTSQLVSGDSLWTSSGFREIFYIRKMQFVEASILSLK